MIALHFFPLLQDFAQGKFLVDWQSALTNEDSLSNLFDSLDSVRQSLALTPDIPHDQKALLLGELSIATMQMDFAAYISQDEEAFSKAAQTMDALLKKIILLPNWITLGQQRATAFEEFSERMSQGQTAPTPQEMLFFQPILLAMALCSTLEFDESNDDEDNQNEEYEDECCHSVESHSA